MVSAGRRAPSSGSDRLYAPTHIAQGLREMPVLQLSGSEAGVVRLHNAETMPVTFSLGGDGSPGHRLPPWLDVWPVAGVLPPGGNIDLRVRGGPAEVGRGRSGDGMSESSVVLPRQELALRVYVQHLFCTGVGQMHMAVPQSCPALLRVLYG